MSTGDADRRAVAHGVSAVVVKGIKLTSYVQVGHDAVEAVILLAIIVTAFAVFTTAPAHPFSWRWFSPLEFSPKLFANGALVAIFFYYGWDVTLNLSEETRDPGRTPGRAAFWAMVFLMASFSCSSRSPCWA